MTEGLTTAKFKSPRVPNPRDGVLSCGFLSSLKQRRKSYSVAVHQFSLSQACPSLKPAHCPLEMAFQTTILVDYSAEHVRTALRAYFTIFALLIGFIGNSCCGLRAQLSIIRRDHVGLANMTGWLKGLDLVKYGWKLRAIPGGWLGLIMFIVTTLSLTSDLAVAGLVRGVQVPRRCLFGQGLVLDQDAGSLYTPSPNGAPVFIVTQAQATSLNNSGLHGIYRKANNATNFRADEEDYLGTWNCSDQGTANFDTSQTAADIIASLQSQGLLFNGSNIGSSVFGPAGDQYDSVGDFTHLVAWSSSLGDEGTGQPFEVRASIDLEETAGVPITMWSFHCMMNASDAEYITSSMHSQRTLSSWGMYFQGSMYYGTGTTVWPNSGQIIERLLNTMTMVAGGMNSLQREPLGDTTAITQGCLAPRTAVPWAVAAMVLVMGGIALSVCLLFILLQIWILAARHSHKIPKSSRRKIGKAPNDLVDWMTNAVKETATGGGQESKTIKKWTFGRYGDSYGLHGPGGPSSGVHFQDGDGGIGLVPGKTYQRLDNAEH